MARLVKSSQNSLMLATLMLGAELGLRSYFGWGMPVNKALGQKLLQKCANRDHPLGVLNVATIFVGTGSKIITLPIIRKKLNVLISKGFKQTNYLMALLLDSNEESIDSPKVLKHYREALRLAA